MKEEMIRRPSTYQEAAAYIEELPKFTKKHPLRHTREFLRRLGNPSAGRKVVHVAGTNGKGSVCAYLQAILMAEGKKTGFFTSPHLVSVNERIRIDNVQVEDDSFLEAFLKVYPVAVQMEAEGLGHPSYFEFLFGMGMSVFEEQDVEYIILETGLGGRLDATNSVEHPALTVITSVSLDHTGILGDTIEQIAWEKAGIIKNGVPLVFDGSNRKVSEVIKKAAQEQGAPCREISKNAFEILEVHWKYIAFSRANAYDKDVIYHVPFCGIYQVMNAELALCAAEYLLRCEKTHPQRWKEAVASLRWEGRMELAGEHLVIDGAHNPGAVEAFVESVKLLEGAADEEAPYRTGESVIVFSAAADKKYEEMIRYLCSHLKVRAYVATEIDDARRVSAETLGQVFRKYTEQKVVCRQSLEDALHAAKEERGDGGRIYCLGSLYLAGMVKKLLAGGGYHAEF